MSKAVIYIHGKGGSADEASHYTQLFPNDKVIGFDYYADTPWDAIEEFQAFFKNAAEEYESITIIANSIGAYFAMNSLSDMKIEKAYFISPIVDMERLIESMMQWAGVDEVTLRDRRTIETPFGETLSIDYLDLVRNHPIKWDIPTAILYGANDNMQSIDVIEKFTNKHQAELLVMENGEHWFHTEEQMAYIDNWIKLQEQSK